MVVVIVVYRLVFVWEWGGVLCLLHVCVCSLACDMMCACVTPEVYVVRACTVDNYVPVSCSILRKIK